MINELDICVVCKGRGDADLFIPDPQLDGPVCPECHYRCRMAVSYLAHHGMSRPFCANDINRHNAKRFIVPE
jgi:hypothetical protein